jgi:hypothetical protein
VDLIQGRVLSGILMELKEEYTPRVAFQEGKVSLVPLVWQTASWEMQIKEEFVLWMWQGGTLYSKLQPSQKERYWSTWKEMMVGQGLSKTTKVA